MWPRGEWCGAGWLPIKCNCSVHESQMQFLSCTYPCTDNTDLSKNPTTALYMLTPLYPHYTLLHVSVHKGTHPGSTGTFCAVSYPGIFFSGEGGSTNSAEDRGGPERGSGGRSPLLRGSGGSCNLVQEISFYIKNFLVFWYFKTIYDDNQFICHC
jgi:hypothetical protein